MIPDYITAHCQNGLVVGVHLHEESAAFGLRVVHHEELPVVAHHVEEVDNEFAQGLQDVRVSMHCQVTEWWVHASMHTGVTGLLLLLMGAKLLNRV